MKPPANPIPRLKRLFRELYERAYSSVRGFGRQTDEVLSGEPIDFSSPSIPYYESLAARMSFARVVLYMVLLVFVVVTVVSNHRLITYENLYYLAKDIGASTLTAHSEADHISYPISSAEGDFALFRGGIAIAGSEVVTVMSGSGRQTLSDNVAYADPCIVAGDRFCITFGRGESSFAVYNAFVRVHAETTEFPIYDAAAGGNGSFAVVTRSRDYTSEVLLYDGNMERLADYHLNGYVTGLAMNAEGDRLGVVSAEAQNGIWVTKITVIRIGNRITQSSAVISGSLGSTCGFVTDDRFAVLLSDRLMVFDGDATVTGETIFSGSVPALAAIGRGTIAVLASATEELTASVLTVYDRNAREEYRLELSGEHPILKAGDASSLCFGGNALFIRAGDTLFRITGNGRTVKSLTVTRDTLDILPLNADEVMVFTPAYAYRAEEEDFS